MLWLILRGSINEIFLKFFVHAQRPIGERAVNERE